MENAETGTGRATPLDRFVRGAAMVSGVVLFAIMLLVAVDVGLRYLLNRPFFGAQDLIEMGMVIVAMFAMAYCARTKGHIAVDVFESALGVTGRRIGDFVTEIVSIVLLALMVLSAFYKFREAYTYSEATNLLGIPLAYLYAAIVFGFSLQLIVIVEDLLDNLKGKREAA